MAAVETNNPNTSEDIEIEATSLSEDVEVKTSEEELKEESTNAAIPTLHNIYHNGQEVPEEKTEVKSRSKISRSLYSKLHKKNFESHTVSKLKGKFEQTQINNDEKSSSKEETKQSTLTQEAVEDLRQKYSPASFGYPKPPLKPSKKVQFSPETKTKIPIPAPRKNIATVKKPESVIEVASVELKVLQPEKPAVTYIKPVENGKVKDENANVIPEENVEFAEPEEKHFVLRASSSDDSIAQVESILNEFIMDGKPKEKKRSSSFRKILSGSFFGKDKKKGKKNESIAENVQNESSSFVRGAPHRHTTGGYPSKRKPSFEKDTLNGNYHNEPSPVHKELEEKYAQMHINKFNEIKNNFTQPKPWNNPHPEDYVCMDIKKDLVRNLEEPTYGSYMNSSNVSKYIDTSSSSSTTGSLKQYNTYENALIAQAEMQQRQKQKLRSNSFRSNLPTPSREPLNLPRPVRNHRNFSESPERFSATPPRAQETYQNLQLVKPKALIPISSERALPNPFQNGKTPSVNDCRSENERTLDRNLNTGESKDYPNKSDVYCPNRTFLNDTYGTVFDSIENKPTQNSSPKSDEFLRNRSLSPANRRSNTSSPRSPSLEGSKLRLPPNREKIELQPRIKSPIPQAKVSTDKIIATELLKPRSSPITVKKQQHSPSHQNLDIIEYPESIDSRSQDTKLSPVGRKTFSPTQELVDGTRNSPVTSKPPVSPKKQANVNEYEAAEWYRKQKEIDQFPTIPVRNTPPLVTTDAMVHKDPHLQTTERPSRPVMFTSSSIANNNNIYGQVYPTERSVTPVNTKRLSSSSLQLSPEKQEMRQNVEAFYWKELKKLKEKEEMEYYYQLQRYGYADDALLSRRSRASTTSLQRTGRRSLSLPRDVRPVRPPSEAQRQPEPIPEDQVVLRHPNRPELIYGYRQPFVRNSQERSTIGPIGMAKQMNYSQRPIFNRGSLNNQDFVDNQSPGYKKAVSFGGHPQGQIWPTRNGYVQNPPQRMVRKESLDDEVFLPNPSRPQAELRGSQPLMSMEAIYNQRVISNGRLSEDLYVQRLNTQCNPIYGQFISNRPPKQITVSNKVCDIYGQIHDEGPKVGILPGQLTYNPQANFGSRQSIPSNFVRGSRLTASANDMYRRYQPRDPRYRSDTVFESVYETRRTPRNLGPLPPVPTESRQRDMSVEGRKEFVGEEEWNQEGGKSGRGIAGNDSAGGRAGENEEVRGRNRSARREDPRRHTLGGDQQYGLMAGQGGPLSRTMDLEGQPRGYPPPSNAMLFDDDPGIMSEVETSSTGFRRGGKQRSSLPVVRTPSKTLERPLGLVFLQYRNETKRALLPNEITSIDTVKALFVRSFPKQLTMEYLDSPQVKIYIHDSSKDMFYELEDLRSHLREIRDRSVLRLFESADVSGGLPMAGIGIAGGVGHFEDPSYFSEPEFDSEYQHQHIHKSKGSAGKAPYYIGSTTSLPRGAPLLRTYSPAVSTLPADRMKSLPSGAPPKPQRTYSSGAPRQSEGSSRTTDRFAPFQRSANSLFNLPDGYMSSPERGSRGYEDPYYQYTSRSGSITPVIDEEISDTEILDESYSLYGVKLPPGGPRAPPHRAPFPPPTAVPYDTTSLRVENIERQIANLTGLVQKAITQTPAGHLQVPAGRENYRTGDEFDKNSSSSSTSLPDESYLRSDSKAPKLGKSGCHKSVSFEKSVSFSDEPPDMNSPKQHSPQHAADTKPPKPAIKSSTLPRTSSQERDRLKPAPPPKPASLSPGQYDGRLIYRDLQLTPEMYNQLRCLQKKAKDLRAEVRNLRRMSQAQAHSVRETIRDTFIKIRAMLLAGGEQVWQAGMDQERMRLNREEDLYKQEMLRLEKDLGDLEATVEELRGNVINRKTRVNMSDVESMALVLSKSSKTVADLKLRFPGLQDGMKAFLSTEMEKVVREEKFLKEEPERLESALRRCKKLTGTLVTLKRLASVQEQRLPCSTSANDGRLSPQMTETPPITPTSAQHSKAAGGSSHVGSLVIGGDTPTPPDGSQRPENALDALLDELQTFSKPHHPSTVNTQLPQSEQPPAIPVKGIIPPQTSNHPLISEIGRKGSVDSASFLPTQNLTVSTATGSLRRLHSYPSGSDTDNSPPIVQKLQVDCKSASKPPLPERNAELLQHISGKRVPPPPPPRTSSKSPLASPTSPSLPPRDKPQSQFEAATQNLGLSTLRRNVQNRSSIKSQTLPRNVGSNLQVMSDSDAISASNSSSCESVNSQDGSKRSNRKEELEQRHQELLKKQKALQEQYARLQQLQRGGNTLAVVPPAPDQLLKKTGSESNLLQKMGLQLATTQMTGSLTHLPNAKGNAEEQAGNGSVSDGSSNTSKVFETDIL